MTAPWVKPCRKCGGKDFDLGIASKPRKDGQRLQRFCRTCRARTRREWHARNREAHNAMVRAWTARNREKQRAYHRAWVAKRSFQHFDYTEVLIDDIHFAAPTGGNATRIHDGMSLEPLRCASDATLREPGAPLAPSRTAPTITGAVHPRTR